MNKIICIGSPYHQDQIGLQIGEQLKQSQHLPKNTQLILLDRPGAALLSYWQKQDNVLIIDAFCSHSKQAAWLGGDINLITKLDTRTPLSLHGFSLRETMQLAQALQSLPQSLYFFLINIEQKQPFDREQILYFTSKARQFFNHGIIKAESGHFA